MGLIRIGIPVARPELQDLELALLAERHYGDIAYLQWVRSMSPKAQTNRPGFNDLRQRYNNQLNWFCQTLAAQVSGPFDAIVTPPSSRPHLIEPYLTALRAKFSACDLSGYLERKQGVKSGDSSATLEAVEKVVTIMEAAGLDALSSVLFVDDVLAEGKTAAVVFRRLRSAGLSPNCRLGLACPLWVTPEERSRATGQ